MRTLRIHTVLTIMVVCIFCITGCGDKTGSVKDSEFLTASEYWYHYDEVTGENEKMSFSEDFTFYWGCECGEPVGNSDCYDLFDYDKETSVINLYNDYDDMTMAMEVLDYSDYHLLLRVDGKIKNYTSGYSYSSDGPEIIDSEKYLEGYSGEFSFLDANADEIVLGPFDYDGDIEYPENAMKTYKFSGDVEAYTLTAFIKIKDGEVVESTVDYEKISVDDIIEYGGYGFVWFNDELEISKILIYGATVYEE